jgi:hypothetical protein
MYSSAQKSLHYGGGRTNGGAKTSNINNSHLLEVDNGVGPRPLHGGRSSSHSSNSSASNNPTLNHKGSHHGLNAAKGGAYNSGHHSNGSNMSLPSGGGGGSGGRATSAGGGAAERPRSGAYDQSDYSNGAHSWPILFAVIPPLGALIFGKSDIFSDMLTLILIAFFLYNIIKGNIRRLSFWLVAWFGCLDCTKCTCGALTYVDCKKDKVKRRKILGERSRRVGACSQWMLLSRQMRVGFG